MKKVFFDANIVVDILAERQPWFPIEMEVPNNDDVIDLSDIGNSGFAEYVDEDNDESEIVNEEPIEQFTEVGDGTE